MHGWANTVYRHAKFWFMNCYATFVVAVVVVVEMFKVSKMTAKQQAAIYVFYKT